MAEHGGRGAVPVHRDPSYDAVVADDDDPFKGIPFLGDIASIFGGNEEQLWEGARQAANQLATGGKLEHNVDPVERHRLSEISRVAELHVAHVTGLQVAPQLEPVTRSGWATSALETIRPLMDRLSERLRDDPASSTAHDPFAGLLAMMSPMTVAMTAGMMAGHLATSAFGNSDLMIPREHVHIVTANIAEFANEWSLDVDDVMLWVAIREHTMHAVLAIPEVHAELHSLLLRHIDGFRRGDPMSLDLELPTSLGDVSDPQQLQAQFGEQLQRIFGNPELLLGVTRDEGQSHLETLICVLTAYVDDVVAQAGPRLIGGFGALSEAVRRRALAGADYADRLLGVRLTAEARDRGDSFVAGVIERAGREGLARLFEPGGLPTPNELVAPGLWLARLDLPL
ncbi:MAG: zinc-dependent metalloprotease [Acidimicrobiales bacterium]|nr:zinc-dependent metalloprotease [Acidimicrobiales bacterium]MXY02747.1 zinc-dependent metalloprotease [Acidimicrobiales bacterium]MYB82680.1 zinc-dependent metalloprotease [Acidimicrobiales bacterium]MYG87888.1 zinc-dependent metalloprotease [Acidimicrobiales bacterium]MYI13804.1 zinc-dependent metalloprotease [Acidimicrobiales bacterium]